MNTIISSEGTEGNQGQDGADHGTDRLGTPDPALPRETAESRPAVRSANKSARSRAREFALQALYQYLVGGNGAEAADTFTRGLAGFHKADSAHYDALVHGCAREAAELDALLVPLLDRPLAEISPIERGILWIGAYEFQHAADVPWRVVINECVELAKAFGGTDGHKYVNAVLNQLAPTLRPLEVQADRAKGKAR